MPVLAIAAHIPREEIGGSYFQETHPQELFRECSVYCELVSVPEQLPRVLEIAMRTALERRGVAVVVIPAEVFLTRAAADAKARAITPTASIVRPSDDAVIAAAEVLNGASRVTILAGAGCAGAHDEVVALAGILKAPVVHALRGKEFIEYDNPYDVGMTGLLGFASGAHAMEHCDALLMLGTDFPYRSFYPDRRARVQVDVRGEHIGRRVQVDVPLVGTVKDTIDVLTTPPGPQARRRASRPHDGALPPDARATRRALATATATADRSIPRSSRGRSTGSRLTMPCSSPDVGTPTLWAARYLRMNGRRRLLGSFNHGSMANALPQAIGVQAAQPQRQVVTLSGDGGLAMMLGELLTLRQQNLPVKIVVFNNGALAFVELEMKADGFVNFGTDLDNPSFAEIGKAVGLHTVRVERPSELGDGLRAAFAHPGARADRGDDRAPGAVDPSRDHALPGQRLHALGDSHRALRPWRRTGAGREEERAGTGARLVRRSRH